VNFQREMQLFWGVSKIAHKKSSLKISSEQGIIKKQGKIRKGVIETGRK
jgi:hypothetical protein